MKMKKSMQGRNSGKKIGVIVAKFNEFVTKRLLEGCLDELGKNGIKKSDITVFWAPGAFELPLIAVKLAQRKTIDAVICLGAVIRGETIHFDLVAQQAAEGIMQAGLTAEKPVIFGVITTDTINQAYARSEKKGSNKGRDAAIAALEMLDVLKQI